MYLSELELHGFKSFANKTKIKFDSGITAIVGPNGCGKSNIVDAIRWVLGEQRPTLLRSVTMANVIFNGTAQKKALGLAEVAVTIQNNKGILPTEFQDVTITRRLYRSGESDYLLNNTPCRLKDIIELFMDTGMGANAYSVIELKMVEDILNDKDNERRKLFEEAAGVIKYKEKRRMTFKRLDETREDLQRIEDILVEIRKNARSLQIQAGRAKKAKEYQVQLEQLDLALSRKEFLNIQDELKPLMERIVNAESEKEELDRNLERLDQQESSTRENLHIREQKLSVAQKGLNELKDHIRETETTITITSEKIQNEEQTIRQYEQDIYQSEEDIKELRKTIQKGESDLAESRDKKLEIESELDKVTQAFDEVDNRVTSAREQLDSVIQEHAKTNEAVNALENKKVRIESRRENSDEDMQRIHRQADEIQGRIGKLQEAENELTIKLETAGREIKTAGNSLEKARTQREQLTGERDRLKDTLRNTQSKLDATESEIALLQNIANSHEAFPSSIRFLLDNEKIAAKINVVSDVLATSEEHALALESVLGDACNYLVVDTEKEAMTCIDLLKENKKGKATFIPLEALDNESEVLKNSLSDFVTCDKKYVPLKNLLLGHVLLFDTIDAASSYCRKHRNHVGVTKNGDVITSERFLRSGSTNKNTGVRVGLKDKIKKLEQKKAALDKELNTLQKNLEKAEKQYLENQVEELEKQFREKEQEVRNLESRISSLKAEKQVHEKNHDELDVRRKNLVEELGQSGEELKQFEPEIAALTKRSKELLAEQLKRKDELARIEESRERSRSRLNDVKLRHQNAENEMTNHQKDIDRAESSITAIKERLQQRSENAKNSKEKIIGYRSTIEEARESLKTFEESRKQAEEAVSEADKACARERGRINQIEEEMKESHRKREVTVELVHHLDMAKTQFDMQIKNISDHIWETYGILMENIDAELPDGMDAGEAREIISGLKQKLKNIGEVNALAIEEYEKENERLEFYEQQVSDLVDAEEKLRETIKEINETAQQRFNSTFEQIRANFKNIFSTLFDENDHCDLLLEENDDDPLESKIEIVANPRGKRPSGINQLSTGEKTVTAIALLFAIYLVKPSPFCILDEVDAPLDDANVERFAKVLRRFSQDTQFIIITHNKKMMEKAEMMYGVTMPEIGVSQLVGVQMDEVLE